ncbi:MAG: hypothetical protein DMD89_36860, partial [Candidatus Rokuibacteriota bacterium]
MSSDASRIVTRWRILGRGSRNRGTRRRRKRDRESRWGRHGDAPRSRPRDRRPVPHRSSPLVALAADPPLAAGKCVGRGRHRVAREEIFGPVTPILTFDTVDEVVARVNATTYGLGAYLYTRDL